MFDLREKLRAFKMILLLFYGSIIGLSVHRFILHPTGIPFTMSPVVAGLCCLLFALLTSCSIQFQCISVLVWLEALGKASRSVIKAFVIALMIVGPLNNIILNSKELTRVIECTTYLTYNLSKTKVDLAVKPFSNAFSNMDREMQDVTRKFQKIQDVLAPVLKEIEYDDILHQKYLL